MAGYLTALQRAAENSLGSHLGQDEAHALIGELMVADAAHAYCDVMNGETAATTLATDAYDDLFAAHHATTPSASPATHTIVAVERLARLEAIERLARDLRHPGRDEGESWVALKNSVQSGGVS